MDNILTVLESVFKDADARNWDHVETLFAPEVLYDYTSLAGGSPLTLTPKGITDMWKQFLPGFDKTHHLVFDFKIAEEAGVGKASFSGHADHFIGEKAWGVTGKYEATLSKTEGRWLITQFKFIVQDQSGDPQLAGQAMERVKSKENSR